MFSRAFIRSFSSVQSGTKHTLNFKNYLKLPTGQIGSYFHDVPLSLNKQDKTVSMVVEIGKQTHGKFEISKEIEGNPIVQDTKKGKLRFIKNVFPFVGYPVNYGAIPQTWEDPTFVALEQLKGDNDPLDVVEIGDVKSHLGQVKQVKVLGCLGLIDDGELDWKIVAVDVNDKRASELNDIVDVQQKMPGLLDSLREWFKDYKIPDDGVS
ncbi:unnamed protein product [Ambrosiozyma monospora]|uniref:inorganic diphosphatase n=1 Tax=Ambrosiozyma monospora TaxID=43982 RepID=A0A9W6YY66_AMBMO|nr:unnamed protein product [Ambrosiozyma monospora]